MGRDAYRDKGRDMHRDKDRDKDRDIPYKRGNSGSVAGATMDLKDLILKFLSKSRTNLSLSELHVKLIDPQPDLKRRTLQRAVLELLESGQVSRHGSGPATTYSSSHPVEKDEQDTIPLTRGAKSQLAYLALPAMKRTPVTYRDKLLYGYSPNRDFYLSEHMRLQLHDMGRTGPDNRPAGTHLRDVLGRLLIDLSWASSKLEGNRYTLLDTKRLIEEGKLAEGTNRLEAVMILNHKAAIEMIAENPDYVGLDRRTFLNLHALLADGLMRDEEAVGRLRRRPIDITGSVYTPTAIPQRIEDCFNRILAMASEIDDPFESSFFLLVHIPYLQPFEDVNKRVSRLGSNIPLIKANLSPLSFVDMPETLYLNGMQAFYETGKTDLIQDVYLAAYDRSCQRYAAISKSMVEPDPFRIAWRAEIFDLVHRVVTEGIEFNAGALGILIPEHVPEGDRDKLVAIAVKEVEGLHEGNFMRYRLRPHQFQRWMDAKGVDPGPDT